MTAVTTDRLIAPHGGTLVDRTGDAPDDLGSLEVVTLTSRELSDLDMIASGALSPLEGFMGKADYERVVEEMHLESGLPWALPVCLAVDSAPAGDRVALADEGGRAVAVLEVEETYEYEREREAEHCFRTTDEAHPGVARLYGQKPLYLAGRVTVFERATAEFPELARDPAETRRIFAERGWKRVVGFQTRNPIHRAHEYLTKVALETVDGLLVHPLVGDTKSDDVPVDVRVDCYRTLLDGYYPDDRVLLSAFPAAMRYAAHARPSGMRSAARTTAARTSSSAATTQASATTTGRMTRSSSSTSSRRTSSTSSRCSSSTRSGATSAARWRARSRARTVPRTVCSSRGRRCVRCSVRATCRRSSSRDPRSRRCSSTLTGRKGQTRGV